MGDDCHLRHLIRNDQRLTQFSQQLIQTPSLSGQEGEIAVRGPNVMLEYLKNPQATAETSTPDGWLRTGDIAMIDADGYMFIVDRLKELIKYKGFQVAPAELEATLVAMPGITDAAVIGLPDDEAGEAPVAFIVAAPGTAPLIRSKFRSVSTRTISRF